MAQDAANPQNGNQLANVLGGISGVVNAARGDLNNYRTAVREWLRANALAAQVHHQAEVQRLIRMTAAQSAPGTGGAVNFDVPFPGTQTTTTNTYNITPPAPSTPAALSPASPPAPAPQGWLSKISPGLLLAAALAGIGGGGYWLANRNVTPATTPAPTNPAGGFDTQIYERGADGQWHLVPVNPAAAKN